MKNKYFNEREKRLFNFFSSKDNFYKGCYFGETNPIIDKKINKIEKGYVSDFKKQLKKTKDKHEQKELLELIKLYEKPTDIVERKVEEVVPPAVIVEKVVKKQDPKAKDPIKFKQSLVEEIPVVLFFGAIHFSSLIRANLAALKIGGLIN
jgi:hypothetical protein